MSRSRLPLLFLSLLLTLTDSNMINNKTSAYTNPRILLAFLLCSLGVMMALIGAGAFSTLHAQPKGADAAARTGDRGRMARNSRQPIKTAALFT